MINFVDRILPVSFKSQRYILHHSVRTNHYWRGTFSGIWLKRGVVNCIFEVMLLRIESLLYHNYLDFGKSSTTIHVRMTSICLIYSLTIGISYTYIHRWAWSCFVDGVVCYWVRINPKPYLFLTYKNIGVNMKTECCSFQNGYNICLINRLVYMIKVHLHRSVWLRQLSTVT